MKYLSTIITFGLIVLFIIIFYSKNLSNYPWKAIDNKWIFNTPAFFWTGFWSTLTLTLIILAFVATAIINIIIENDSSANNICFILNAVCLLAVIIASFVSKNIFWIYFGVIISSVLTMATSFSYKGDFFAY